MSNLEEDDNLRYDTLHVKEQVDDPRPVVSVCVFVSCLPVGSLLCSSRVLAT